MSESDHLISELDEEIELVSARRCILDLIILISGFFLVFTAFNSIQNLESSLNSDQKDVISLGNTCLFVLYGVFSLTCLIAPRIVNVLGPKRSIICGFMTFCLFVATNYGIGSGSDINDNTLKWLGSIFASIIVGVGAPIMWTSQGRYLTDLSVTYAEIKLLPEGSMLGTFNGMFYGIFQGTQIVGNLISSLILDKESKTPSNTLPIVYLCCVIFGTISAFFLRKLPNRAQLRPVNGPNTTIEFIDLPIRKTGTFELFLTLKMFLLVPIFINTGIVTGFIFNDFTSAVVQPSLGSDNIGFVMATFGLSNALSSIITGKISDKRVLGFTTMRIGIVIIGLLTEIVICIFLMVHYSNLHFSAYQVYLCAVTLGFVDAINNTILCALIGALFPYELEPAFSNYKLWQSVGFTIVTGLSVFQLNPDVDFSFLIKLIIVMSWNVLSLTVFIISAHLNAPRRIPNINLNTIGGEDL